jgi:hypothetical protein
MRWPIGSIYWKKMRMVTGGAWMRRDPPDERSPDRGESGTAEGEESFMLSK